MKSNLIIALGCAISSCILVGCQGGAPVTEAGQSTPPVTQTPTATSTKPAVAQTPPPPVPEVLKGDGYHYYGLANEKPMKIKLTGGIDPASVGTQTFHLKSVEGGKAIFEVERTGVIGDKLGTETLSLEKDGIFTIKSTLVQSDIHNIELPAKLPVGATWKNTEAINQISGEKIEQNEIFKVVGPQKVTTEVGVQDALLITSSGMMKFSGQSFRMDASMWYVKDRGLVKSVFNMRKASDPKAKPQVITIQETK